MPVMDVCRLCSVKENLVWLFDKTLRDSKKMREIIFVTTGVEIHMYDTVSQKICEKCLRTTSDIFEFRKQCLENDKRLKEKRGRYLKTTSNIIPNTNVIIKNGNCELAREPNDTHTKPTIKMHASIKKLFQVYPGIKLPTICLSCHVAPVVYMPINEVEDYFKSNNKDLDEYNKALEFKKMSFKKASINSPATDNAACFDASINAHIFEKNGNKTIRPIKIKLTPSKSSYEIINSDNNKDIHLQEKIRINITERLKETKNVCSGISKRISHQKRKLSEEHSNTECHKEPTLIDSLGLIPKLKKIDASSTNTGRTTASSFFDKSTLEHICTICNAVKYNNRDFKKHQNKHLRCQFCRKGHRTFEKKMQHTENCLFKKAMDNLPSIEVDKIENNLEIRRMYPAAFSNFPPLAGCDNINNSFDNPPNLKSVAILNSNRRHNGKTITNNKFPVEHVTAENSINVVEIISEKEDLLITPENNVSTDDDVNSVCAKSSTVIDTNRVSQNNNTDDVLLMVKPRIKIKGSTILEKIGPKDSDLKVLKKLLSNYKYVKLFTEEGTQTEMPTSRNILINQHDLSAEFTDLQQQMNAYKIPVVISHGLFNVSFNNNPNCLEQPKRLHLWNDLKLIDIKNGNTKISSFDSRTDDVERSKVNHCNNCCNNVCLPGASTHNISSECLFAETSSSTPFNDNSVSNPSPNTCDISSVNSGILPSTDIFPSIIRVKKLWELT